MIVVSQNKEEIYECDSVYCWGKEIKVIYKDARLTVGTYDNDKQCEKAMEMIVRRLETNNLAIKIPESKRVI